MKKILCVDIETISLDEAKEILIPWMENLKTRTKKDLLKAAEEAEAKKQAMISKAALSPLTSKIFCIGYCEIIIDTNFTTMEETIQIGEQKVIYDTDEIKMLNTFKKLIENYTEFVTFNGRKFDFPYIAMRGALKNIKFNLPIYHRNVPDGHYDIALLLDDLSGIDKLDSSSQFTSLEKWMKYFGFQEKEIDSKNIKKLFEDGEKDKVFDYCKNDVLTTAKIFIKFYHLFRKDN